MRVHKVYCIPTLSRLCVAAAVCSLAGCWEEIQYTGPDQTASASSDRPVETDESDSPEIKDDTTHSELPPVVESVEADAQDFAGESTSTSTSTPTADESTPRDRYAYAATQPLGLSSETPRDSPTAAEPDDLFPESDLFFGLESSDEMTEDAPAVELAPPATGAARRPAMPANDPARSTRRLAWLLGSKLSLAALANERGVPADDVARWFDQSQSLATMLGTSTTGLPPRPATPDPREPPNQALGYLFGEGRKLGRSLAIKNGDDHAALFELAVKSNVLLAVYRPNSPMVGALAGAIRQASERSRLPTELCQPLLDELDRGGTQAEVQDTVFQLHADVDRYLSTPPPPMAMP